MRANNDSSKSRSENSRSIRVISWLKSHAKGLPFCKMSHITAPLGGIWNTFFYLCFSPSLSPPPPPPPDMN